MNKSESSPAFEPQNITPEDVDKLLHDQLDDPKLRKQRYEFIQNHPDEFREMARIANWSSANNPNTDQQTLLRFGTIILMLFFNNQKSNS